MFVYVITYILISKKTKPNQTFITTEKVTLHSTEKLPLSHLYQSMQDGLNFFLSFFNVSIQ